MGFILSLLAINSCREDDYREEELSNQKKISFRKINKNNLPFKTRNSVLNLEEKITINPALNRSSSNEINFIGNEVIEIQNETTGKTFYTLYAEREFDNGKLENIILTEGDNGDLELYLVAYDKTSSGLSNPTMTRYSSITGLGEGCWEVVEYAVPEDERWLFDGAETVLSYSEVDCPDDSSGSGDGSGNYSGNDSGNNSGNDSGGDSGNDSGGDSGGESSDNSGPWPGEGGGGSSNTNIAPWRLPASSSGDTDLTGMDELVDGILTSPNLEIRNDIVEEEMGNLLSEDDKLFLNYYLFQVKSKVNNFLINNNSNPDKLFIDWVIDSLKNLYFSDNSSFEENINLEEGEFIEELKKEYVGITLLDLTENEFNYLYSNPSSKEIIKNALTYNAVNMDENILVSNSVLDLMVAQNNNTINELAIDFPSLEDFKEKISHYLTLENGIKYIFRMMRAIYVTFDKSDLNNSVSRELANLLYIDPLRTYVIVNANVNLNPQTMSWEDIVLIWLFELGNWQESPTSNYPNIPFTGNSNTVSGSSEPLKNHSVGKNSVGKLRDEVIGKINNGINSGSEEGENGFTINDLGSGSKLKWALGSYKVKITYNSLGDGSFLISYEVYNDSTWESGTRSVENWEGTTGPNSSVIDNKERGEGIHLGGSLSESFFWFEIYTP